MEPETFQQRKSLLASIMEKIPNYDVLEKYNIPSDEYRNDLKYVLRCREMTKTNMKKLNTLYHKYKRVKQ